MKDTGQGWKVGYPLCEVLFLVVCGTIANGDDYEDIVDWGKAHLSFLRGFAEFHYGIPCADWLRTVMNRINPDLFQACFSSWVDAIQNRARSEEHTSELQSHLNLLCLLLLEKKNQARSDSDQN